MASILYKWSFLVCISILGPSSLSHPIYVSVTEIEHNAKDKTLEISCKIFTDDFEKALRNAYHTQVDLLKVSEKDAMNRLVNDYVQKHLQVTANGKVQQLQFKGYEQIEEGIYSYFEIGNIAALKNITVKDNILYEYQSQQINLLHITVNGTRQSTKLVNPEEKVTLSF